MGRHDSKAKDTARQRICSSFLYCMGVCHALQLPEERVSEQRAHGGVFYTHPYSNHHPTGQLPTLITTMLQMQAGISLKEFEMRLFD